jgi:predicted metal-dependent HD superfamily phosphohydrolase
MYARFQQERFERVWRELGLVAPAAAFDALAASYAEPHRAYHTAQHIDECLELFDAARDHCEQPALVELALWFHDAVYDTHRTDNELRSADWVTHELAAAGAPSSIYETVRALIMVTRHNAVSTDPDANLTTDIDLSILGSTRSRFIEYESQVRREYEWVPEEVFRRERAKLLRHFLARPSLYATEFFRERFEQNARENLEFSLEQLSA